MKKIKFSVLALFMAVIIFSAACSPSYLPCFVDVKIVQEPSGGFNINSLTCKYSAAWRFEENENSRTKDEKRDITVTAVWVNDKSSEYGKKTITLGDSAQGGTFVMNYVPSTAGQYFDKTFWVKITWDDSAGEHTVTSSKAICVVK